MNIYLHILILSGICEPFDSVMCQNKNTWVDCSIEDFKCDALDREDPAGTECYFYILFPPEFHLFIQRFRGIYIIQSIVTLMVHFLAVPELACIPGLFRYTRTCTVLVAV